MALRAWHVYDSAAPEYAVLVFAVSGARARARAYRDSPYSPWEYTDYLYLSARRAPQWDRYADAERCIDTNADLPAGAPPYYGEED